jgi:4-amino-4-deoxy-L-arabinose transferase-like glycosyltransferase
VHAPLTADEGGYAEVARLWDRGAVLYREIWVDRPQGLLLVFRALERLGWGSPEALRLAAAVAAALVVISVFGLVRTLARSIEGYAAAFLLAVLGASPFIESFTLAGELLASLPVVLALLLFAAWLRIPSNSLLLGIGLLAGVALTLKQSALDGLLAPALWLLLVERRRAWRPLLVLAAGALLPLAACAVWAPHFTDWWHAVVAYRGEADSLLTGSPSHRLRLLVQSLLPAAAGIGPLVLLAVAGWRRSHLLLRCWVAAAAVGFLGGGNFHPHYYLQLAPPLAAVAGVGLVRLAAARSRMGLALAAGAAAAALVAGAVVGLRSPAGQARAVWPHDPHLRSDAALARWVDAHTTPGQRIYALWAAADLYRLADRPPAFRYLWARNVQAVPGALAAARRMLAAGRPVVVLVVQAPGALDKTGETARILERRYRVVATVRGTRILRPN